MSSEHSVKSALD